MNGKNRNKIILAYSIGGALFVVFGFVYGIFFRPNLFDPSPAFITVSRGQSFSSVADSLMQNGIISGTTTFKIAGRLLGVTQRMRIGRYSFLSGANNYEMLTAMEGGKSVATSITLREGVRTILYARWLQRNIGIDSAKFMQYFYDTSMIGIYPHHATSLEGYLMPNTYNFFWQDDEKQVVQRLITEFREFFVDSLQRRTKALGMTLNEVMTMASIIEWEAVYDDERPVISGVYYNRLKRRMKLQADPTVLYAVSDFPKRLTTKDLRTESPYNTYIHYGLPPGPINNPGKQSIIAALYPAHHNFLYFVADNNGRHRFGRNYQEHLKNVQLYRRARALAANGG